MAVPLGDCATSTHDAEEEQKLDLRQAAAGDADCMRVLISWVTEGHCRANLENLLAYRAFASTAIIKSLDALGSSAICVRVSKALVMRDTSASRSVI
jgi:hypothetical protein